MASTHSLYRGRYSRLHVHVRGPREFGLELIRRCQYALNIEWGYTWDQPNVLRGDSGQKTLGTFLVQNMLLWIVPAAAEGKDLAGFCAPGGFVDRILQAAKKVLNPRGH